MAAGGIKPAVRVGGLCPTDPAFPVSGEQEENERGRRKMGISVGRQAWKMKERKERIQGEKGG